MIKRALYPKTARYGAAGPAIITEKIDGSNIGFYKAHGMLWVAQRNNIFRLDELLENKDKTYKGLYDWLTINGKHLEENLHEGSGIFGEWLGMGKIKYGDRFNEKVLMFAKFNMKDGIEAPRIDYNHENFEYPFLNCEIPDYIGRVPIIDYCEYYPTLECLNELYGWWITKVITEVEGFVVYHNGVVTKYVRCKNGRIENHRAFLWEAE